MAKNRKSRKANAPHGDQAKGAFSKTNCNAEYIPAPDVRELLTVFKLHRAVLFSEVNTCDCCATPTKIEDMVCGANVGDAGALVSWVCSTCGPEVELNGVDAISTGVHFSNEKIASILVMAAESLDADQLAENSHGPFVRRPLYVERLRAARDGYVLPNDAAVVITVAGNGKFRRQLLPVPFPWGQDEWIAGSSAARDALAVAAIVAQGGVVVSAEGVWK